MAADPGGIQSLTITGNWTNTQTVGSYIDCTGLTFTVGTTDGNVVVYGSELENGTYSKSGIYITANPLQFTNAGTQNVVFTASDQLDPNYAVSTATATKSVTVVTNGHHGDGTIAGTILAMKDALDDAFDAVSAKGGTVPSVNTMNALPTAIQTIPSGGSISVEALSVSANGTYTAPSGHAYSPVTVSVAGGGGVDPIALITLESTPAFSINDNTLTIIRHSAFISCKTLTNIYLGSCGQIGASEFYDCTYLGTASLPACKSIGANAFHYCSNLVTASAPLCEYIGSSAFRFCTKLINTTFTECKTIEQYAFCYCSSLRTVNLPNCEYIGAQAFVYCRDLSSISLPACKTVIGYAFSGCPSLALLSLPAIETLSSFIASNTVSLVLGINVSSIGIVNHSATGSTNIAFMHSAGDTVLFSNAEFLSQGTSKSKFTYNIYTNNATISSYCAARATSYTTVNIYPYTG